MEVKMGIKEEEEIIISKINILYRKLGNEKFCLFSNIFMSAFEECKVEQEEIGFNDLNRLLEESLEKLYSKLQYIQVSMINNNLIFFYLYNIFLRQYIALNKFINLKRKSPIGDESDFLLFFQPSLQVKKTYELNILIYSINFYVKKVYCNKQSKK